MHDVVLDYPLRARGNDVPVGQVADRLLICGNDRVPEGGWHPLDATNNRVVSKIKTTQQRWTGERFYSSIVFTQGCTREEGSYGKKTGLRVSTAVRLIASAWKD